VYITFCSIRSYVEKIHKTSKRKIWIRSGNYRFDNDGIISVEQSTQNKSKIMYKDIKQVIETKEIILIISKAGYTTFFERKNVESNDLEKLKQFFDKQNILWEKSICNIF
jgi:hypothetical protein